MADDARNRLALLVYAAIFAGIGAAVFGIVLVVGGFLVGLTIGYPLLAFLLPMLGVVLSLFLAQWFASSLEDTRDDPFALRPRTSWRLCDPELRNYGVWRADFDPGSLDVVGLDDPTCVRRDIERLNRNGLPQDRSYPAGARVVAGSRLWVTIERIECGSQPSE